MIYCISGVIPSLCAQVLKFNLKYLPVEVVPSGIFSFYRYHGIEENYIITYWSRTEAEFTEQQAAV